jgi:serine/threonine-protein kinase
MIVDNLVGQQIGSYTILARIGQGGMGVVYRAVHEKIGQEVAIKLLNPQWAADRQMRDRFIREASLQAKIAHTNIVRLLNFVEEGDCAGLVMEYVEGETLDQIIRRQGALSEVEAVRILNQALEGVGAAHALGIIHRDLKPGNIMLTMTGGIKVTDFGIAKAAGLKGLTSATARAGTVWYMSPEQVIGQELDIRSDLYSLGVTLYEMVTGRVPFDADTDYKIMQGHKEFPPPSPSQINPQISEHLEQVILTALMKRPEHRFQTAEAFRRALAGEIPVQAPVGLPQGGTWQAAKEAPHAYWKTVVLGAALLLGGLAVYWSLTTPSSTVPPVEVKIPSAPEETKKTITSPASIPVSELPQSLTSSPPVPAPAPPPVSPQAPKGEMTKLPIPEPKPSKAIDPAKVERELNRKLRSARLGDLYAEVDPQFIATLTGTANSQEGREKALNIARAYYELKSVRDNIQVKEVVPPSPPSVPLPRLDPAKLEGEINRALRAAGLRGVTTEVHEDFQITLKGSVGNAEEKRRALEIAKTFQEVKGARDLIFVVEY